MNIRLLGTLAGAALLASAATAQLVIGTTSSTANYPTSIYLDVATGAVTPLYNFSTNKKVNGMAATRSGKIYTNDAARLSVWNEGQIGVAPTLIAGMFRTNGTVFTATGIDDMTFGNGKIYGWAGTGTSNFSRGIYSINPVPDASNRCLLTAAWSDTTGAFNFQGLAYNPATNKFFGMNTSDNTATGGTMTRGLYVIDASGSAAPTKIANMPTGRTEVDGLALADNGTLWMTEKDRNSNNIYVYSFNTATLSYGTGFTLPYTGLSSTGSMALASGAAWAPGAVPEPATMIVLGAGVVAISRRRRR